MSDELQTENGAALVELAAALESAVQRHAASSMSSCAAEYAQLERQARGRYLESAAIWAAHALRHLATQQSTEEAAPNGT